MASFMEAILGTTYYLDDCAIIVWRQLHSLSILHLLIGETVFYQYSPQML